MKPKKIKFASTLKQSQLTPTNFSKAIINEDEKNKKQQIPSLINKTNEKNMKNLNYPHQLVMNLKKQNINQYKNVLPNIKSTNTINSEGGYQKYTLKDYNFCQKSLNTSLFLGGNFGDVNWQRKNEMLMKKINYNNKVNVKNKENGNVYDRIMMNNYLKEYLILKNKRINFNNSTRGRSYKYSEYVRKVKEIKK